MQLLALAGSFFLIICSVAARSTEFVGPCTKARQDAGQPMPGKFVPQCTEYGFFQPAQCHASTGKCWCVIPDSGKPVDGSIIFRSGEPKCTICLMKRSEALRPTGVVGNYVPQCGDDGLFTPTQRHGSTGQSWCVNPKTGEEIPGTRTGPSQPRVQCPSMLMDTMMMATSTGACFKEVEEKLAKQPLIGQELPQCNQENGDYMPVQYQEGFSFCVNPKTGAVEGKKNPPGDNTPLPCVNPASTGACFKEVEKKRSKQPMLGQQLPQCNPETGDYLPVQYREGYSFCVNPKTGVVEGKVNRPGDNTPLPCVNPAVSAIAKPAGACLKEVEEKSSKQPLLGQQLPQCNPETGDYLPVQYREGYSFCVNPKTGALEGKINPPGDNTPLPCVNPAVAAFAKPAGACAKEVEEKRTKQPMLGQELPQCNPETGDYLPVQHKEGYSFCVNPKTGALEGKVIPPGDNTPLPCVNH